jgi:DNA-binding IclR family transcriptional regulator
MLPLSAKGKDYGRSVASELAVESRMIELLRGFATTQAIAVAARLGVADLVAAAPRTVDELAYETKTHAPSLRRLLQCLTSLGIF